MRICNFIHLNIDIPWMFGRWLCRYGIHLIKGLTFADLYQTELLGITCGSFFYVALVNILPELK